MNVHTCVSYMLELIPGYQDVDNMCQACPLSSCMSSWKAVNANKNIGRQHGENATPIPVIFLWLLTDRQKGTKNEGDVSIFLFFASY